MCKGCGKRQSKMPSSWILDDCCFYCPQCWEAFACRICGHHDPKGYDFKGSWNCRACRHKRQVKAGREQPRLSGARRRRGLPTRPYSS